MQKYRAKFSTLCTRYNIVICLWCYIIIYVCIYLLDLYISCCREKDSHSQFSWPNYMLYDTLTHCQYYLILFNMKNRETCFIYINVFLNFFEIVTLIFLRIFPDLKTFNILYGKKKIDFYKNQKKNFYKEKNERLLTLFWLSLIWKGKV